ADEPHLPCCPTRRSADLAAQHAVVAPHDDDRLVAEGIDDMVAGVRHLLLARDELPDERPHPLGLEPCEFRRDVTGNRQILVAERSEEHTSELQSSENLLY